MTWPRRAAPSRRPPRSTPDRRVPRTLALPGTRTENKDAHYVFHCRGCLLDARHARGDRRAPRLRTAGVPASFVVGGWRQRKAGPGFAGAAGGGWEGRRRLWPGRFAPAPATSNFTEPER